MGYRVYELAKLANVASADVLSYLRDTGEFVRSASSKVSDPVAKAFLDSRGAAENKPAAPGKVEKLQVVNSHNTWQANPVKVPDHPELLKNIKRLERAFPVAAEHLQMLRALGSQFVYADVKYSSDNKPWGTAMVRFSGAIESAFGLTREVAFFYFPYGDLQVRQFRQAKETLSTRKKSDVTPDLAFFFSPDERLTVKLTDWSKVSFTAIPLPINPGHEPIELVTLLRDRVYARDLFYETTPVSGERFFGRQTLLQELRDDIKSHRVSGLFGLRKSGKTSILYQLRDTLASESVIPVFVDLESLPSPPQDPTDEFIAEVSQRIMDEIKVHGVRSGQLERAAKSPSVASFKAGLSQVLAKLQEKDIDLVLMLDEIEFLTPADKMDTAEGEWSGVAQVLSILRAAIQSHENFTFILAGLTNHILENGRLYGRPNPLFSWAKARYVGPFSRREADDLAKAVGSRMGIEIHEAALRALYDASGGHAYLYRSLASDVVATLPIDTYRRVMSNSDVLHALVPWRRSVAGNVAEILNHLKLFYPIESLLISALMASPEDFEQISRGEDMAIHHLLNLGLINSDGNEFEPNLLLELAK